MLPAGIAAKHLAYAKLTNDVSADYFSQHALRAIYIGEQLQHGSRILVLAEAALHLAAFLRALVHLLEADVAAVPAKGCDEMRHVVKLASRVGQTGEVFKVHADPVVAVEQ